MLTVQFSAVVTQNPYYSLLVNASKYKVTV